MDKTTTTRLACAIGLLGLCAIPAVTAARPAETTAPAACDTIWWTGTEPHVDVSCLVSPPGEAAAASRTACDPIWWTGTQPHIDPSCIGTLPAGPLFDSTA